MKYIFEHKNKKITLYDNKTKQYKVITAKNSNCGYSVYNAIHNEDFIIANTPHTMYNNLFSNDDKDSRYK